MLDSVQHDALIAKGIQFSVLARAFPVLRHDALKPISNAKLAAGMMQRGNDETLDYSGERSQQLLADIDSMLDESVDTVRHLADWLSDSDKEVSITALLRDCVKLLFTELLLSGKKITVNASADCPHVSLYEARYIMLCWILHLVEIAPDGREVRISCLSTHAWRAELIEGGGSVVIRPTQPSSEQAITFAACRTLSAYYGWTLEKEGSSWTMTLPDMSKKGHCVV